MKQLQELRKALSEQFLEREELINGMLVALVSGHPCLMIGPPGTAKSAISRAITNAIVGDYFGWCVNKLTTPEELYGPVSLKGLEQDVYKRLTTGKLPNAHVAFIDEIFKCSSAVLNTMLTILNEKEFFNDGKAEKIPLKVLYAASNEVPQGEELAAMFDRFVLKFHVDPVRDDKSVDSLFLGGRKAVMPKIDMTVIDQAQQGVAAVSADDVRPVLKPLKEIRIAVRDAGIMVSDRKWVQSVSILKAQAMLNGRSTIEEDDLSILAHVLWMNAEQRAQVRKIINKHANPLGEKITAILDGVRDIQKSIKEGKTDSAEGFKKMEHSKTTLSKLGDPAKNPLLARAIKEVSEARARIAQEDFGIDLNEFKK